MKIRLFVLLGLAGILLASTQNRVALAAPLVFVSGPTGTMVNGWYTEHPLIKVHVSCMVNGYANQWDYDVDIVGLSWSGGANDAPPQAAPGSHNIRLLSNRDSDIWIWNDGALFRSNGCGYTVDPANIVVWEGVIKWDDSKPTISIITPQNNGNTSDPKLTVSGTISDTGSGVVSVKVNGQAADLSGGKFSISLPLVTGLNTIQAVATDFVGHTSESNVVTVLRSSEINPSAGISQAPQNATSLNNKIQPTTSSSKASAVESGQQASTRDVRSEGTSNRNVKGRDKDPNSKASAKTAKIVTGVSVVTGAVGLGTASLLGYVPYRKIGLFFVKAILK